MTVQLVDEVATPGGSVDGDPRPPRLNCAGWCLWCGERDCQQLVCRRRHRVSVWRVCPDCSGSEVHGFDRCGCVSGLVEALITSGRTELRDTPRYE